MGTVPSREATQLVGGRPPRKRLIGTVSIRPALTPAKCCRNTARSRTPGQRPCSRKPAMPVLLPLRLLPPQCRCTMFNWPRTLTLTKVRVWGRLPNRERALPHYRPYTTTVIGAHSVPRWYEALDRMVTMGHLSPADFTDAQF